MDNIILGMLMLRRMTIYAMKVMIAKKLDSMCSSSSGSIHTAIRKLMKNGLICCSETGEKKIYCITEQGRAVFNEWINQPMTHSKAKDIELGKLFFLGAGNPLKRESLILQYVDELKKELKKLQHLQLLNNLSEEKIMEHSIQMMIEDLWNSEGIKKNMYDRAWNQTVMDIYQSQMATLQFGIDSLQFEIDWYLKYLNSNRQQST